MIHGPTDHHIWAQSYDRDLGDTLALQEEVAEAIAREVAPAVYEAYLRGLYFLDEGNIDDALTEFHKVVAADPNYAPAYTKIASAYFGRAFFGSMPPKEAFPTYEQKRMFPEALSELRQATQLTNNFPFTLSAYAEALAESGDRRGAMEVLTQLQERAKVKYVSAYDIGLIYAALGEKNRAFEWLEKAESERASFLPYITWDRRADSLRDDPRFDKLLHELGLTKTNSASLHIPDGSHR